MVKLVSPKYKKKIFKPQRLLHPTCSSVNRLSPVSLVDSLLHPTVVLFATGVPTHSSSKLDTKTYPMANFHSLIHSFTLKLIHSSSEITDESRAYPENKGSEAGKYPA